LIASGGTLAGAKTVVFFTFLQDSRATIDIVLGDARFPGERGERGQFQRFDVMVLTLQQRFHSGALLTKEAMALNPAS